MKLLSSEAFFNPKCSKYRSAAGLRPDRLGELTALSSRSGQIRPGSGQVRPGSVVFTTVALIENNYFDQLNFTFDCHDYIALTHNRNCNRSSIPSTSTANVCSRIITSLSHRSLSYQLTQSFSVYETCTTHLSNYNVGQCPTNIVDSRFSVQ